MGRRDACGEEAVGDVTLIIRLAVVLVKQSESGIPYVCMYVCFGTYVHLCVCIYK